MKIEEKIYALGIAALDEILLHRNVTKKVEMSIEDAVVLSDMIVHIGPHGIFTFKESEIADFYRIWAMHGLYSKGKIMK